jgi:hypothetical protein
LPHLRLSLPPHPLRLPLRRRRSLQRWSPLRHRRPRLPLGPRRSRPHPHHPNPRPQSPFRRLLPDHSRLRRFRRQKLHPSPLRRPRPVHRGHRRLARLLRRRHLRLDPSPLQRQWRRHPLPHRVLARRLRRPPRKHALR